MVITFQSDQQKSVYKRVARLMIGLFGDHCTAAQHTSTFAVEVGSAEVEVMILPWHDDALVLVRATVVSGARVDEALLEHLLRLNMQHDFGAFALAENNDIVFKHGIMGANLDENELRMSVWGVMRAADDHDDEIKSTWGGKRAIDVNPNVRVTSGSDRIDGDFSDETEAIHIDELTKIGV